jgi:hypothetical protein
MKTSTSFLESRRAIGDPPADAVIADLASSGSITAVNALMRTLVENDQMPSATLPESVREYLATTGVLPTWMEAKQVKRAENVFWRYGPQIIVNLFCHSLPYCYAARKGVQVLALTSRLYTNPTRRVIETAQMIVDVMQPGGLLDNGSGVRSAQKVRLMHAGVRAQIAAHPESWNPSFGVPINQEDLAATLMSFSWIVIDGLRRMGHPVSDADAEAYLHCWKVVGHLLGVEPDLLPENMTRAGFFARAFQEHQYSACPEGRLMTKALIGLQEDNIPGVLFHSVPSILTRFYMGDRYADLLGVERPLGGELVLRPLHRIIPLLDGLADRLWILSQVNTYFGRRLIEALMAISRGGERPPFSIPTELRQTWGVNWNR